MSYVLIRRMRACPQSNRRGNLEQHDEALYLMCARRNVLNFQDNLIGASGLEPPKTEVGGFTVNFKTDKKLPEQSNTELNHSSFI